MLSTNLINFSSSSTHKGCFVMPGHSRSKNGVASLAYAPGIHALNRKSRPKTWMAGTSPAMTVWIHPT
jgi:hypothetical protein